MVQCQFSGKSQSQFGVFEHQIKVHLVDRVFARMNVWILAVEIFTARHIRETNFVPRGVITARIIAIECYVWQCRIRRNERLKIIGLIKRIRQICRTKQMTYR